MKKETIEKELEWLAAIESECRERILQIKWRQIHLNYLLSPKNRED